MRTITYILLVNRRQGCLPEKTLLSLDMINSSGTTSKHGLGFSVWVCWFLPYFQFGGKSFCLTMQHLFVVHAVPRVLVVDIDASHLRMRLISAHALIAKDYAAVSHFDRHQAST